MEQFWFPFAQIHIAHPCTIYSQLTVVFNLGGAVAVVFDVASGVTEMLLLQNINSISSLTEQ